MEKMIACCGLDCSQCEAFIAYTTDDNDLRIKTAEKWRTLYGNTSITPEMINCSGCLSDGEVKISHCKECKIRACAKEKGFTTCAECTEVEKCEHIAPVLQFAPVALENLKSLK